MALGIQGGLQDRHLGIMAEGQRGDLLRVAKPVLLDTRVQVLHHHQATTRVGEEACGQGGSAHPISPTAPGTRAHTPQPHPKENSCSQQEVPPGGHTRPAAQTTCGPLPGAWPRGGQN